MRAYAGPMTQATTRRHVGVLIIGSGFGGLGAAIRLAKDGRDDFLVVERGSEVGGTWRDNTYPGAACDVPSHLYSYSFEPNPDWSRSFSPQWEIQDYLRRTAEKYNVLDKHLFDTEVTSAQWDADTEQWLVETTGGAFSADVVVAAIGALCEPALPDIKGIESFQGEVFHSSRWNHESDLTGKRVAVIGTGASSIQIVPAIADQVAQLDVYQRTAPWVMPGVTAPTPRLRALPTSTFRAHSDSPARPSTGAARRSFSASPSSRRSCSARSAWPSGTSTSRSRTRTCA